VSGSGGNECCCNRAMFVACSCTKQNKLHASSPRHLPTQPLIHSLAQAILHSFIQLSTNPVNQSIELITMPSTNQPTVNIKTHPSKPTTRRRAYLGHVSRMKRRTQRIKSTLLLALWRRVTGVEIPSSIVCFPGAFAFHVTGKLGSGACQQGHRKPQDTDGMPKATVAHL
jgi:hypothetical protein